MDKRLEQMEQKEDLLSHEYLLSALDYNPETGIFKWKNSKSRSVKKGTTAGAIHTSGYIKIVLDRKSYWAHRIAWLYYYGSWPRGKQNQVDHINGNRADNRIINLRLTTNRKNTQNHVLYAHNTSECNGVCFNRQANRWQAYIRTNELKSNGLYKQKHLGYFDFFEDAVKARKQAEKKYKYNEP